MCIHFLVWQKSRNYAPKWQTFFIIFIILFFYKKFPFLGQEFCLFCLSFLPFFLPSFFSIIFFICIFPPFVYKIQFCFFIILFPQLIEKKIIEKKKRRKMTRIKKTLSKSATPLTLYNPFNNSKNLKKMKISNFFKNVYPTLWFSLDIIRNLKVIF